MSIFIGFIFAYPVIIRESYEFIKPGLYQHELKLFKIYVLCGSILFIAGMVFGYLIIFKALIRLYLFWARIMGFEIALIAKTLLDNFFMTLLISGLIFETPVVMCLLTHLGFITNPRVFIEYRPVIYPIMLIIIAVINPDPTIMSTMIWFITFVALYEVGSRLSIRIASKRERRY